MYVKDDAFLEEAGDNMWVISMIALIGLVIGLVFIVLCAVIMLVMFLTIIKKKNNEIKHDESK